MTDMTAPFTIFADSKGGGALIDKETGLTLNPSMRGEDPFAITMDYLKLLDTITELTEGRLIINPDAVHRSMKAPLTQQVKDVEAPARPSQSKVVDFTEGRKPQATTDPLQDWREEANGAKTSDVVEPLTAREVETIKKMHQAELDKGAKTKGQTVFYAAGVVVYHNDRLGKRGLYFVNADHTPILTKEGGYPVEFFDTSDGQRGEEHDFKNPFSGAKGWKDTELIKALWLAADSPQKTTFIASPLFVALKQSDKGYWNFQRVLGEIEAWKQAA